MAADGTRAPMGGLTEDEIDKITERAAERALEKVYIELGRSIIRRVFWLVGVVALAFAALLAGKGVISPGGMP